MKNYVKPSLEIKSLVADTAISNGVMPHAESSDGGFKGSEVIVDGSIWDPKA